MKKKSLQELTREELVALAEELHMTLKKKNELLSDTRLKLTNAKNRLDKMKDIVSYQRNRILKLYE